MENDTVNHPNHYISSTGLECMDVIKAFTENLKGFEAYATGNILKYACRWKSKNGIEDLKKLRKYTDELIDYLEKPNRCETYRYPPSYISTFVDTKIDESTASLIYLLVIYTTDECLAYRIYYLLSQILEYRRHRVDNDSLCYNDIRKCIEDIVDTPLIYNKKNADLANARWREISPVTETIVEDGNNYYTMTFIF